MKKNTICELSIAWQKFILQKELQRLMYVLNNVATFKSPNLGDKLGL
jgi:hypothetical protein